MKLLKTIKNHPVIIRLSNWEYWPFQVVYSPLYPIWIYYCIRTRSLFFFRAANPTIKNGGFLMESKKQIDELIPENYKPFTLFFAPNTSVKKVIDTIRDNRMEYPLIIKPDIGGQGRAVVKVHTDYELSYAISQFTLDYLIQPFIPFPKELGIFYVRYPNEKNGRITGIVEKEFVTVKGDGYSTIEELLKLTPRYVLQLANLRKTLGESIHTVIAKNEERVLVPYGNHVRGSLFLDSTHKVNEKLEAVIDRVCKSVDGFYFGRLDIRFNSYAELQEDKNWSIIELNGAGSEPTHMYDPRHSLFFAWKEIVRHWKMLYKVSMQNKSKGFPFLSYKEGVKMFRENSAYAKKVNEIQFEKEGERIHFENLSVEKDLVALRSY
jgi:hypothetical protein